MKRALVLNLVFLSLSIFFLILYLMIDFLFFIPIICFLPFSFRQSYQNKINYEKKSQQNSLFQNLKNSNEKTCPKCEGKIAKIIAKFCYHCGEKLNNI